MSKKKKPDGVMKDREFLAWIHYRLERVHGEDPYVDYMHRLRSIIRGIPTDQHTPNIAVLDGSVDLALDTNDHSKKGKS